MILQAIAAVSCQGMDEEERREEKQIYSEEMRKGLMRERGRGGAVFIQKEKVKV